MKRTLSLLLGLCVIGAAMAEETLFVQGNNAALFAQPAFNAARTKEVARGDAVSANRMQGAWIQVDHQGDTGWLPKLLLSSRSPGEPVTAFTGERTAIEQGARRRASNVTTAGATRGLTADDRRRTGDFGQANYTDVEHMEGAGVNEQQAMAFLREGLGQ